MGKKNLKKKKDPAFLVKKTKTKKPYPRLRKTESRQRRKGTYNQKPSH